jgi:tetratricopeptide (TPR) repeat protein
MKINILILFTIISVGKIYSQNRYSQSSTSTYKPMSNSEIMAVPMALRQKYDENQKYLYDLEKWIIELKTTIKVEPFLSRLNGEYSVLTSMENDDLARATQILNKREIGIREVISEYNIFVSAQNSKIPATQNLQATQNSPENKNLPKPESQDSQTNEVEDFLNEGNEYYENEDYSKAIFSYSKYLEKEPNDTDALFSRALSKSKIDDIYGAISDYDKILSMEGKVTPEIYKFSTVYNNKAYCLVKLGNYEEALPLVEKALQLDKTEWFIWDTRAEILLNLGQLDKCISDCTKAINIEPNGNSYLVRGLARIKKGEKTKGCQDLSKAGELGETIAYQKIKENCNKK